MEDESAEETKIEAARKKIEETREQKLSEAKETYQVKDAVMCIKLVVKNTDRIGTKYYVDIDSVKEIKESEIKKILPILKVIPAIRDPKNESTAGTNSYLKELIAMLDDDMATNISISGNETVSYRQLNEIIAEESAKRCQSISNSITGYYNEAIGVNDFEVIVSSDVNISKGTTYYTKILDKSTNIESDILSCGTGYQSMIILSILEAYVELAQKKTEYILIIEGNQEPSGTWETCVHGKGAGCIIRPGPGAGFSGRGKGKTAVQRPGYIPGSGRTDCQVSGGIGRDWDRDLLCGGPSKGCQASG